MTSSILQPVGTGMNRRAAIQLQQARLMPASIAAVLSVKDHADVLKCATGIHPNPHGGHIA